MNALAAANVDHALAYGDDAWTARATERFRDLFGAPVEVFFVWGGTGANVVALQSLVRPWSAVACSANAHIAVDECGAPERFTGCKLLTFPTPDGKLTPTQVEAAQVGRGDEHHAQATVLSVTQSTENGTLYSVDELTAVCRAAKSYGMTVHLDGARLANAVAALDCDVRALTVDAGVDVVCFVWGGTGANVVSLQSLLQPWSAVVCTATAHIAVDECGAPERFTGCKLLTFPSDDGKLAPADLEASQAGRGDEHHE
jgi:threonine aldolase